MSAHLAGETDSDGIRLAFDRRLKLEFHGASVTSDAGLLAYRELDDALGLTALAGSMLSDGRRGKNTRHLLTGLLRQSVFGRLAGYEDVNDAERLARDPAMRWIVGGHAVAKQAASTSQIGRFETEWLTRNGNLSSLADLSGLWIERVHGRRPPKAVVLDMDSSVSPTYGEQEGTAYNGHFGCTCYHPLFVFNQFGDLERCALRSGNVHSADGWHDVLEPVVARYRNKNIRRYFRADAAFANPEVYKFLEAEGFKLHSSCVQLRSFIRVGGRGFSKGVPMLKTIVSALAGSLVIASLFAVGAQANGVDFQMACGTGLNAWANRPACQSYVQGVVDGIAMFANHPHICLPPNFDRRQSFPVVLNWMRNNPGGLSYSPAVIIRQALRETFPCGNGIPAISN
jgi:hypothetical protein